MTLDRIVARELSTTALQTRASPSMPDRRKTSVRCSAATAFGTDSTVMPDPIKPTRLLYRASFDRYKPHPAPLVPAAPRPRTSVRGRGASEEFHACAPLMPGCAGFGKGSD